MSGSCLHRTLQPSSPHSARFMLRCPVARSSSPGPTRTSTPPSSGGSPRSQANPARACTPGAAGTTRWRLPCACGAAGRCGPWRRPRSPWWRCSPPGLTRPTRRNRPWRSRGTPICSVRSRCCCPITCARTRGPSCATSTASTTHSRGLTSRPSGQVPSPGRRCPSTPGSVQPGWVSRRRSRTRSMQ